MAVLQTGQSFASGNQVTATKLQDIANLATFRTGTNQTADDSTIQVDGSGGYLKVKSLGITSNELATDSVITTKIQNGAVTAAKLDSAAVSVLMPTGSILPYAGSSAPTGYLLCDGSAQDRQVNSVNTALFTVLGTTYGLGNGSTTFNIPDLRGRVIAGLDIDSGGLTNRLTTASAANLDGTVLGANNGNPGDAGRGTNGAQEHQLTTAQMPSHSHNYDRHTATGADGTGGNAQLNSSSTTTSSTGLNQAHNNVQPTIILNYIIKT
jgi:microcystin-dependent protein